MDSLEVAGREQDDAQQDAAADGPSGPELSSDDRDQNLHVLS